MVANRVGLEIEVAVEMSSSKRVKVGVTSMIMRGKK